MKIIELRQKSKEDLFSMLDGERHRAEELRIELHERKVKNVRELGKIRKDIARILTLIKEKL